MNSYFVLATSDKMVNKKDNSAFREILSFHLFVSLPLSPILPNLCTYIPTYLHT